MNTVLILALAFGLPLAFVLGMGAGIELYRARRTRDPLSVDGLAERADVNGCALVGIARQIDRAIDAQPGSLHGAEMATWSRAIKRIAVEHLECINAIGLDALARVGSGPVHLGDWRRSDAAKQADPVRMRRWGDQAARESFLRERERPHA